MEDKKSHLSFLVNTMDVYDLATLGAKASTSHYSDVIMSAMVSQITGISIICSTVCSAADQRKHQSSASLAFVRGIHRSLVDSPLKGPAMRKMFPFDDVIISGIDLVLLAHWLSLCWIHLNYFCVSVVSPHKRSVMLTELLGFHKRVSPDALGRR